MIDEYAWLADKEDPETIAYLEAENAYTEAMTAGQAALRGAIFGEIKARTQETDLSVPARKGGWWYYTRTVEGQQYAGALPPGGPPGRGRPADDRRTASPLDGEEVLLDGNELAGGPGVLLAGRLRVSPDGQAAGLLHRLRRRRAVHAAGQGPGDRARPRPTRSPDTFYGCAWSQTARRCST